MTLVFILLVIFQVKHWLADYPLQRPWMLGKFHKEPSKWIPPLAAHCLVHAILTYLICVVLMSTGWYFALMMAAFDFSVHFVMDRIKASPDLLGRWKPLTAEKYKEHHWCVKTDLPLPEWDLKQAESRDAIRGNRLFWHALGFDQMVHHLTHYVIIYFLVC